LDIQDGTTPGPTKMLGSSGIPTLWRLVEVAGPRLGLTFIRQSPRFLRRWAGRLTEDEMLQEYNRGVEAPDSGDPFSDLECSPKLNGVSGPQECKLLDLLHINKYTHGKCSIKTSWTLPVSYGKVNASKWKLLHHLVGEAKLSIYTSRKNRVEDRAGQEALPIFTSRKKTRIWVEFSCFFNSFVHHGGIQAPDT